MLWITNAIIHILILKPLTENEYIVHYSFSTVDEGSKFNSKN